MHITTIYKKLISLTLALLAFSILTACHSERTGKDYLCRDLSQIKDSGRINVLTLYSSTSYFKYRGEEMGFHYELAKQFADFIGVELNIITAKSPSELIDMLQKGEGDLIAYNIPITKEWRNEVNFCGEESITHQVVIQNKSKNKLLTDVTDLQGKDVYVNAGKYYDRLTSLNKEIGGGINIHLVSNDSTTTEDLIAQVAGGKIGYTVADDNEARLNLTYWHNLNISLPISFDQRSSWAVSKSSPVLEKVVNKWYANIKSSPEFRSSFKRYFEQSKSVAHSPILSVKEGKISHFDSLFKKYSKEINWDWRLLAALAYTESNFDTTAVSWAGALGLMQLMPATAHKMGMPEGKEQNAEESVKAAVKYIKYTGNSFKNVPDKERIKFILASYNSGIGHIFDAMALAEKYGKDKYVWDGNVDKYLLLKSEEKYFTDSVCHNGYFRGVETSFFVKDILERFKRYQEVIKK